MVSVDVESVSVTAARSGDDEAYAFAVCYGEEHSNTSLGGGEKITYVCESEMTRDRWVENIQAVIDEERQRQIQELPPNPNP